MNHSEHCIGHHPIYRTDIFVKTLCTAEALASGEGRDGTARCNDGRDGVAGFRLAAELEIALPALDLAAAADLVAKAHQVCPYSNATRGNINVELSILEYAA